MMAMNLPAANSVLSVGATNPGAAHPNGFSVATSNEAISNDDTEQ